MTHPLSRCHTSAPLRAVLLVLCASTMLVGSTFALANAVSSVPASLSMAADSSADHASLMGDHAMDDRERAEPCDPLGDPLRACSTDCLASCVAAGSVGACASASGVSLVHPAARTALARAPDTRAPLGASAPPPLPPPIV